MNQVLSDVSCSDGNIDRRKTGGDGLTLDLGKGPGTTGTKFDGLMDNTQMQLMRDNNKRLIGESSWIENLLGTKNNAFQAWQLGMENKPLQAGHFGSENNASQA